MEEKKAAENAGGQEQDFRELTIEETFGALDDLIDKLESGKGSLEDAFKNYETGMKLIKSCNEKIEKIEKKIMVLSGEPEKEQRDDELSF